MYEYLSTGVLIGAGVWTVASLIGYGIYELIRLIIKNS